MVRSEKILCGIGIVALIMLSAWLLKAKQTTSYQSTNSPSPIAPRSNRADSARASSIRHNSIPAVTGLDTLNDQSKRFKIATFTKLASGFEFVRPIQGEKGGNFAETAMRLNLIVKPFRSDESLCVAYEVMPGMYVKVL